MQDMGNDPTREAATCGTPGRGLGWTAPRRPPRRTTTPRGTTRSSTSTRSSTRRCATSGWSRSRPCRHDLASEADTPAFSFITPSLCEDGHDAPCADGRPGGLVSADAFLRAWLPRITSSPAFNDGGLVIVTFDEAETSDAGACCGERPGLSSPLPGIFGVGGGRIGAVMLSPYIRPGTTSTLPPTTTTRCCAASRTCSASAISAWRGRRAWARSVPTCSRSPAGPPAGAPPLLQGPTALGGAGTGKDARAPLGCRSAALPRPRRGRYRRGTLLATAVGDAAARPADAVAPPQPLRARARELARVAASAAPARLPRLPPAPSPATRAG